MRCAKGERMVCAWSLENSGQSTTGLQVAISSGGDRLTRPSTVARLVNYVTKKFEAVNLGNCPRFLGTMMSNCPYIRD